MINIALLGFGTVGQGVYRILEEEKTNLISILGQEINVRKILIKNINKKRDIKVDSSLFTDDYEKIIRDEKIDTIVEVTGDLELSYHIIKRAFEMGKNVITANKALVSKYFEELSELAEEKDVFFLYEASVAGGVPIIKALRDQLRINKISKIQGILNGTCNYILTKMTDEEMEYGQALKMAQDLGYAEADPSSDVKGIDTKRKLRILATLGLGSSIKEEDIVCEGIDAIEDFDIKNLKKRGLVVKLLAEVKEFGGSYQAVVGPKALTSDSYFAGVKDSDNGVIIEGNHIGKLKFEGAGAGMYPTGNAIVTDLIDSILKTQTKENPLIGSKLINRNTDIEGDFYVRINEYHGKNDKLESYIDEIIFRKDNTLAFISKKLKKNNLIDELEAMGQKDFILIEVEEGALNEIL